MYKVLLRSALKEKEIRKRNIVDLNKVHIAVNEFGQIVILTNEEAEYNKIRKDDMHSHLLQESVN